MMSLLFIGQFIQQNILFQDESRKVVVKLLRAVFLIPFILLALIAVFEQVRDLIHRNSFIPCHGEENMVLYFSLILYIFCLGLQSTALTFLNFLLDVSMLPPIS